MSNPKSIKLIVSEHKPTGMGGVQEIQVSLVDEHLKSAKPIAARLCGGTTTCMAIFDTE